ncbi:uncharacterized protein B0I36DRAFT_126134 [Microdochium trichocladiopsis]|uniref:Zn(2)-C6 fungal-type domain-containing protein n=1 Tax=Microdochium trichocladiopsis TaxID=1682393 RepID=A0A9P8Y3K8_9PEZI|nr:uncharacterized protein B0I36DRAFT_126134 [Microdochium trichocladiopsis]KAH7028774.1 hypothetical protein B0I36DRAFT_126134 [Microdochium trichocladiopsis]
MSSSSHPRASKRAANSAVSRSPNACERCRKQKIRCSGSQPCDACTKRSRPCHFDETHQRVVVTRGYIRELQRRAIRRDDVSAQAICDEAARNVSGETAMASGLTRPEDMDPPALPRPGGSEHGDDTPSIADGSHVTEEPGLTNFLTQDKSPFMTAGNGMTYYLGASSNWTFTQKVLSMVYERAFRNQIPDVERLIEGLGNAYDLPWDGIPLGEPPSLATVPTIDHAIYLINAVKFHCTQLFHLFDEETFIPALYAFYQRSPGTRHETDRLWLVHFMLILSFGKAFTVRNKGKNPAGIEYFIKALQFLPSTIMLWRHPVHSTEVLSCIALYLQCLDYRIVAHNYMGQALRLALNYGLHTDIQRDGFGKESVERIRRVWWTLFILDREMTSIAGVPQSIQIDDVQCQLPEFSGSSQRIMVLKMQLTLSQLMAKINQTMYGVGGKLHKDFLRGIENALGELAQVHEELYRCFPVPPDQAQGSISRTSAHLYLSYYRCIILATRPILFCFIKIRLDSWEECQARLHSSNTARNMLQMCLDASIQILVTLDLLLQQNLIDPFLPFDLDSVSAATINILVAMALDHEFLQSGSSWITTANAIFAELVASGNQVAAVRVKELDQLKSLLAKLGNGGGQPAPARSPTTPSAPSSWVPSGQVMPQTRDSMFAAQSQVHVAGEAVTCTVEATTSSASTALSRAAPQTLDFSATTGFSFDTGTFDSSQAAEIIELANSVADIDSIWVSDIIGHDSIW